jgi:hypothetical protein
MDAEMLEEADIAVLIPPKKGRPPTLRRLDYIAAPWPAPRGWEWAVERLLHLLAAGYA